MRLIRLFSTVLVILFFLGIFLVPVTAYDDDCGIVYKYHDNSEKKIALTFDDGPHKKNTGNILDILLKYNIHATFFVVGENVRMYPELLLREIDEGHEIGNHTYHHKKLKKMNLYSLKKELTETENSICGVYGDYFPKLFRPPEGYCGKDVIDAASDKGYSVILWTVDTEDWRHTDAEKIVKTVLENVRPGSIILCHDFVSGESHTAQALEKIIPELISEGYVFVTVSELLEAK